MLRDRRFIGALILAFVAAGAWNLHYFRGRRGPAPQPAATHAAPIGAKSPAGPVAPWHAVPVPAAFTRPSAPLPAGARNPFLTAAEQFGAKSRARMTDTSEKGDEPPHLEGIALYGGVRAALIGGEPVREGAFFGNTQVVRVEENQVTFARDGRVWRERVPPATGPSVREDDP